MAIRSSDKIIPSEEQSRLMILNRFVSAHRRDTSFIDSKHYSSYYLLTTYWFFLSAGPYSDHSTRRSYSLPPIQDVVSCDRPDRTLCPFWAKNLSLKHCRRQQRNPERASRCQRGRRGYLEQCLQRSFRPKNDRERKIGFVASHPHHQRPFSKECGEYQRLQVVVSLNKTNIVIG